MVKKRELFQELMKNTKIIHEIGLRNRNQIGQFQGGGQIIAVLGNHNNEVYQNELAKMVHVRPGSLSQVLTRLERDGYIQRQRDEVDRRLVKVSLTKSGLTKHNELSAERQQFVDALLAKLTVQDCQELVKIGQLMVEGLQERFEK